MIGLLMLLIACGGKEKNEEEGNFAFDEEHIAEHLKICEKQCDWIDDRTSPMGPSPKQIRWCKTECQSTWSLERYNKKDSPEK